MIGIQLQCLYQWKPHRGWSKIGALKHIFIPTLGIWIIHCLNGGKIYHIIWGIYRFYTYGFIFSRQVSPKGGTFDKIKKKNSNTALILITLAKRCHHVSLPFRELLSASSTCRTLPSLSVLTIKWESYQLMLYVFWFYW